MDGDRIDAERDAAARATVEATGVREPVAEEV
jgi:hypothetical protein